MRQLTEIVLMDSVHEQNGVISMSHMSYKDFVIKGVASCTHVRTSYLIPGTSGWALLFKYLSHWKFVKWEKEQKTKQNGYWCLQ